MRASAWFAALAGQVFAVVLLAVPAAAADPSNDVFTVGGVPVDATAANANAARDAARREGERRAWQLLLQRLTLASDKARLPKANDRQIEDLVQGFEVANERSSAVRYLADYTFHFRPDAVRKLLRQAGVPFADTPSKPLLVLPVYDGPDGLTLFNDPNPWRDAWTAKPPPRGLVPFVLPLGELADLTAIDAESAARGDEARLKAISANYDGADVLVARAAPKAGGTPKAGGAPGLTVTATRYSPGAAGAAQTLTNSYAGTPGESEGDLMARAAAGTAAQVEEAWKRANILDPSQTGTLVVTVPTSDLQSWIAVRDQLSGVPAIQGSDLIALDRQGARLALHYVGDPAQLRLALAQRDLELSGNAPDWVLRRRDAAGPH